MHRELRTLAEQVFMSAEGDWELARERLFAKLMDNRALFDQFVVPLVREAVSSYIGYIGRMSRQPVHAGHLGEVAPTARLQKGQKLLAVDNLMNYPMRGGHMVLGDATKEDLTEQSSSYLTSARSMRTTGRWFALVAEKLPNTTKTVREVLTETQLREMRAQAAHEAA